MRLPILQPTTIPLDKSRTIAKYSRPSLVARRERYSQAIEYMAWFEPVWSSLTDTEQHILSEFYMGYNQKSGATYRLMSELSYSERKIKQMRSDALQHLQILLFG